MSCKLFFKLNLIAFVFFLFVGCNDEVKTDEPKAADATAVVVPAPSKYIPFDDSKGVTKISPNLYTQLADTLNIRVLQGVYKPGDSSILHAHPDFALYVLEGSTAELTGEDGKKQNVEFKTGMAVVLPAAIHSAKNIGKSTLRLVVMEVNRPRE
jgi:quercetin dioxygenase-like cupin family protein